MRYKILKQHGHVHLEQLNRPVIEGASIVTEANWREDWWHIVTAHVASAYLS